MKKIISLICLIASAQLAMASSYYWVGGTGKWSDYANHWATSSGGAIYRTQVPTLNDDVFFDANSFATATDTVYMDTTILVCHDMDWSAVTNNPHLQLVNNNSIFGSNISIFGSLAFSAAMTTGIDSCIFHFKTNGIATINLAGHSLSIWSTFFDGTGSWTLLSDLTTGEIGRAHV